MKKFFNLNKYQYILIAILLIGCAVRIFGIVQLPAGLNQDEASSGYEAFSVLNYGIDRNGTENPVHLISWGSGQNMAYSWICMPFVAVMGLNVLSLRLPMAIVGCISIYVFYLLFKELWDEKSALWSALFFSLFPWHIMKSRWGLESNLFPDLVLWACLFLVYYLKNQKPVNLYITVLILSFSLYSYGTAYMFMPFFVGGVWIYMLLKKRISVKHFILSALLFFVTALPILMFVLINITDLSAFKILGFTVPKMYQQRFSTVTGTGENFFIGCFENLKELFSMFIRQGDGLPWNGFKNYGLCYLLFIPLIPLGIVINLFERKKYSFVMNWWFVCAVAVAMVTEINVNRINIIFIPVAYYIAVSLGFIAKQHKALNILLICVCFCLFGLFGKNYIEQNEILKDEFFYSYEDALTLAESYETDKIYIDVRINQPYMLTLFYTGCSPHTYLETRVVKNPYAAFERIESFDRYYFRLPEEINSDEDAAFIVQNDYCSIFDPNKFEITSFYNYSVAVPKNL